ncbi:uncharacterized protein TNCV_86321 [Trichonephila clavipes]|nr:uncharacterized protein TNCV_86321 [Trichonephila clavipes]
MKLFGSLPIEEIATVVEHQDRLNQLQPWSFRPFSFTKTACFKLMIPPKIVIIIWRLTTELNMECLLNSNSRFCLCKLENTKCFLFTSRHFSTSTLIGKKGGKLAYVSRTYAANKTVSVALSFDV